MHIGMFESKEGGLVQRLDSNQGITCLSVGLRATQREHLAVFNRAKALDISVLH
jgi:hypothetical protein